MTATIASNAATMTIGQLSRRTGLSVKTLRRLEGMGLIYTAGRSPAGYRLFDQDALWCVLVLGTLRGLGLTLAEIRELDAVYLAQPDRPLGRTWPSGCARCGPAWTSASASCRRCAAASTTSMRPTRPSWAARAAAATSCSPTTPGTGATPPALDPATGGRP